MDELLLPRALRLRPRLVPKPWGGRRLAELGRDLPDGVDVGESWEVADLTSDQTAVEDPTSRVADGPLEGRTLAELAVDHPDWLLGRSTRREDGRFPLLVKLLDAREPLSVQVHPTAATVRPGEHVKEESWIVLAAEPDATLLLGLREHVTPEQLEDAAGTPRIVELLREVPVTPGDVLHVPPGVVHALGAGVLVAEIQTPSDTTYRLYDWTEELGRAPRELHEEAGVAAVEDAWSANMTAGVAPRGVRRLVETADYDLACHPLDAGRTVVVPAGRARVLLISEGMVRLNREILRAGEVRLVPAGARIQLSGFGLAFLATAR